MDNQKEKLIAEIRKLFLELLDEEKEREEFVGKVIRTVYPNKDIFVCKANMLYNKALELEKLDSKYSAYHLNEVMSDEVYMVDKHEYDFDGLIPKPDSVNELKKRMRNAVYHLKLYYNDVLGDIKIE
jgi:hypothetical protein